MSFEYTVSSTTQTYTHTHTLIFQVINTVIDSLYTQKQENCQLLQLTSDDCDVRIFKTPTKLKVQEQNMEYEDQSLLGC
jgi:hypothetical protein